MKRWRSKGQVKNVGHVGKYGRPSTVYGKVAIKNVEHDVLITDYAIATEYEDWIRGENLERRSDAVFWVDDRKCFLELDTGSMGLKKVDRRWDSYLDCEDIVIVVSLSEKRIRQVKRVSEKVADCMLFTTLERVQAEPHGTIYETIEGERLRLSVH